ncbi:hypothetical protein GW853_02575 [Candidatus Kuenenbacteria bacterium]|uniref:Type ISP restriction-modification enzyme LLaBIII C-terminal specificity domain-containing protein n=5 Tax=Candidatus Kueneniibacteriota TaxID=1752740 RepID=A0A2M7MI05_9BACT|nr:hypothetical protein [Candidatus Kuenenbacteria bacterium]OIP56914.1 MAG: hypothetical protein AUK13_00100 [Candidatus Kuenenbacteria bacterium CG2_30_39_24]PIX92742.1 MAG: hypothetical protein COZ26_00100 [Candidatus Kuenenbacteria bacterium CG_4_10_14_3_um_filter_39_14]
MKTQNSKIHYSDLYGEREEKFKFLESHTVKNTKWEVLNAKEPRYFFVPKDFSLGEEYNKFVSISEIFKEYNRGVVTSRDNFAIGNLEQLKSNLEIFTNKDFTDEMIKQTFKITDTSGWKIKDARQKLTNKGVDDNLFVDYLYRPFDRQKIYYEDFLLERARKDIMGHMQKENLCLLAMRQVYWKNYNHVFVSNTITDSRVFISNRGAADIFPLYLYPQKQNKTKIFKGQKKLGLSGEQAELENGENKTSNIKQEFLDGLKNNFGKKISAEEVFNYIYAVLYSNKYREKYQEFLKIDFPRVPFGKDYEIFKKLSKIGENLIQLHLLKDKSLGKGKARFMGTGVDNVVRKRAYDTKENKIWINNEKYFDAVETEVWNYYIGGYQVLDKWLKDRLGRELSREDIGHYLKVVECLKQTIKIQKEIDEIYFKMEKELIKIN